MDFAKAMSAAMAKTKPPTSTPDPKQSKYLKRSEIEAQREEAYRAEQAAAEKVRVEKALQKRKLEEDEAERKLIRDEKRRRMAEESQVRREEEEAREEAERRRRLGLAPLPPAKGEGGDDTPVPVEEDIDEDELREKLRGLKEPVVLFAETHESRLKRYRALTAPRVEMSKGPVPTTLRLLPEAEMRIPEKMPAKGSEREHVFRQLGSYFTLVVTEWIRSLLQRDQEVKESNQGRQAWAAMEQSRENLKPLFRMFESGELKDEMLEPVMQIVRAAQARKYVDANNKYLELSIGKA